MKNHTVFIKRYPSKGEFPKQDGIIVLTTNERLTYSKTFGWVTFQNYTTKAPEWWLEEIELPSGEAIRQFANELAQEGVYKHDEELEAYADGALFIIDHIKGGDE